MTEYEHQVIGVFPTEEEPITPFAYSVGLMRREWPELLMVGIDGRQGCEIINLISEQAQPPSGPVDIGGRVPLYAVEVDDPAACHEEYTCRALPGPVVQLVIPDPAGRYPWDDGCEEPYASLPVLGTPR